MATIARQTDPSLARRHLGERLFGWACRAACATAVLILMAMLLALFEQGRHHLDLGFLRGNPSLRPAAAGIRPALHGTFWTLVLCGLVAVPCGAGAAIYLEEFAPHRRINRLVEINIANLSGVPSILYGLLGLAVFVHWLHLGRSAMVGGLTLAALALPAIILAARQALRDVPESLRQAALAVGATRWPTVRDHVLPAALPGILAGVLTALARIMGEAAPLLVLGAISYLNYVPVSHFTLWPSGLWNADQSFTTLPLQIFDWATRPQPAFHQLAASAILVLLGLMLILNVAAAMLRRGRDGEHNG